MRQVKSDLTELCRAADAVELGRRIRQARLAAELTQAQLAGDDVSDALISRIEDGQRRPDATLLIAMATRLNVTPEQLLFGMTVDELWELRGLVDQAELALASGNAERALATADQALATLGEIGLPDLHQAALHVRAGALEAMGELSGAIAILEELTARPVAETIWLKDLIALSRCRRDAGDLPGAIAAGEDAFETIEELGMSGTTEAIQLTVTVAAAYAIGGDLGHALRMCKVAIDAADRFDLPIAKASAYWNASRVEDLRGDTAAAVALATEALALFELGDDTRNLGKLRSQLAYLMLKLDPPDAAGALDALTRAERELAWSAASAFEVAAELDTRSRAHLLLGEHAEALEHVRRSEEVAPAEAPSLRASATAMRGRIAAARGRLDEARALYRTAAQILTGMGADRGAAQLWFELGTLFAEIGDSDGALDAFKRAAASTGLRSIPVRP